MAEKRPKINASMMVAERQLREELSVLNASCPKLIAKENKRLAEDLSLIDDLISLGGMDKWTTVWSAINNLTDGAEVEKLMETTHPTSRFHKNYKAVFSVQKCLEFWLDEEVIANDTNLHKASIILANRMAENTALLEI